MLKIKIFLWMLFIFTLSSIPSARINEDALLDFVLRKSGHIFEYFVLFVLIFNYLKTLNTFKNKSIYFVHLLAGFFTILYAVSDEFHQSFVPGRGPSFNDVLVDTVGIILGNIYIWKFWSKTPTKIKKLLS